MILYINAMYCQFNTYYYGHDTNQLNIYVNIFPQAATKEYCFIVFMGLTIMCTLFIFFKVPETRNLTLQEISEIFVVEDKIKVEDDMSADKVDAM